MWLNNYTLCHLYEYSFIISYDTKLDHSLCVRLTILLVPILYSIIYNIIIIVSYNITDDYGDYDDYGWLWCSLYWFCFYPSKTINIKIPITHF